MASTAFNAQGTTLEVASDATDLIVGTADTAIENLISFSGFDAESAEIDVTNLVSTAKEKLAGLQDFGSFSGNWHTKLGATGQDVMRALQASGYVAQFVLTFPDASTATFNGVVKNAQAIEGGVDAAVGGSFSIAVSGLPAFA